MNILLPAASCVITTCRHAPIGKATESESMSLMPLVLLVVKTGLPCEGSDIFQRSCQPPLDNKKTSPCAGKDLTFTQKLIVVLSD